MFEDRLTVGCFKKSAQFDDASGAPTILFAQLLPDEK